ncbi:hypothetical protein O3P69_012105 [Scylla paramamosain]|uniref:Matrin-type domain-containing protein n=1 Tax=Scylla paramamosain TaxID=85552 RepID=A0AAW0TBP2_SCYPA
MVKRYYCDFCDCSYPYSDEVYKKHRTGHHHTKLRRAHYDKFKTLEEERRERKMQIPTAQREGLDLSVDSWLKQRKVPLTQDPDTLPGSAPHPGTTEHSSPLATCFAIPASPVPLPSLLSHLNATFE